MKKLLLLLLTLPLLSFGQVFINQEIVETAPYVVGDTLTIRTTINTNNLDIVFFTFDTQITNSALQFISAENIATNSNLQYSEFHYSNFVWKQNSTIGVGDLDGQYNDWKNGPKNDNEAEYLDSNGYNIHRYAFLTAGETLNGAMIEEKFILLTDTQNIPYRYIHRYTVADAQDDDGVSFDIGSQVLFLSIDEADISSGNVQRQFKLVPPNNPGPGYDPTQYSITIDEVTNKDVENYSWQSVNKVAGEPLDANGRFFTDVMENGKEYWVYIYPNLDGTFLDQVVTVSDVYLAFKNIMDVGPNGEQWNWDYGIQEILADVTWTESDQNTNGPSINAKDVYSMFAHILGEPLDYEKVNITGGSESFPFWNNIMSKYGVLSDGPFEEMLLPTVSNESEIYEFGVALWGDVDFSHSTTPVAPGSENKFVFGSPTKGNARAAKIETDIDVATYLEDGKVIMDFKLTKEDLAGMQFNLNYDASKLTFDTVTFDSGNEVFNFATPKGNKVILGSIDREGTARVKTGTPYRLIFTPKQTLQNTAGLVTFELTDAVNGNAERVKLNIQ